ncbi:hypothetical protein PHYPSEUDO_001496 [Phytophthora pseudosyringae]|uniref:Uncharacterized protein n=1 Tax=Phytophthora pseudosyringae TaxID=221518 RepID=A0A8T1VZX1_9STRA|nr:hypothetical protein PHYPSEUDO_001496 [Phytophthora pseudosyringae]
MATSPRRRRCAFSLDEKRRVLEHLRACGHVRETVARFYPTLPPERYDARRRLVLSWRRRAREILAGAATRQGAARKRLRKPKTHKPQPPTPQGLADEMAEQDAPFLDENEPELDEFEPVGLRTGSSTLHGAGQGERELQGHVQHTQDQAQEQGGIQDLIATAVQQSTRRRGAETRLLGAEQSAAPDAETGTGSGAGRDEEEDEGASDVDAGSGEGTVENDAATCTQRVGKRCSFPLDEKRRVLEHLAATKSVRETIEKFYPDLPPEEFNTRRRTIWRWRKCREQIVAGCADDKASARKKMRPRGIVCQRRRRHVEPQHVVDRLLTSVKQSEQRASRRKGNRVLRPAPPTGALLAERQVDALVFSALGLPPTTQFPIILPAPTSTIKGSTTAASVSSMRPLQRGEATFAIRRR